MSDSLQHRTAVQPGVERLSEGSGQEVRVGLLGQITPTARHKHLALLAHTRWFLYKVWDGTEMVRTVFGFRQELQDLLGFFLIFPGCSASVSENLPSFLFIWKPE